MQRLRWYLAVILVIMFVYGVIMLVNSYTGMNNLVKTLSDHALRTQFQDYQDGLLGAIYLIGGASTVVFTLAAISLMRHPKQTNLPRSR